MYNFIENEIRGGLCQATHRYATANNPSVENYNPNLPLSYIRYFDANNLYGFAMKQKLPVGNFKWSDPTAWNSEKILALSDEASTGYIFECDLVYPKHLHDIHNDLPLAPETVAVGVELLSPYQKLHMSQQVKSEKLVLNFYDKQNYVCH